MSKAPGHGALAATNTAEKHTFIRAVKTLKRKSVCILIIKVV